MYRYSRGQPGQGSLPRPAWGSGGGSHGARTASPEPGGLTGSNAGTPLSGGATEEAKQRLAGSPQEEGPAQMILQLENELLELRNACSWKDQRIADLSRTDTPAARLKRDIRHLAAELHHTRKELSESVRELQEMRGQMERGEAGSGAAPRDIVDAGGGTPSHGANSGGAGRGAGAAGSQLRGRIVDLEEENRSLRETVVQLKAQGLADTLHQSHVRQPSGASTQRVSEPPLPSSVSPTASAGTTLGGRQSYTTQQVAALQAPTSATLAASAPSTSAAGVAQEERLQQLVYSSHSPELAATLGPTHLQGVGTVDGVAMVAKVLLQRIQSSVCSAHRRGIPMAGQMAVPQQLMAAQAPMT